MDYKNLPPAELKQEWNRISREMGDTRFGTRKELEHLPSELFDGEKVLAFTSGMLEKTTWLIILTDQRIMFLDKGLLYGLKKMSIPLDKVTSAESRIKWFYGDIKINHGSGSHSISWASKKSVSAFTTKVQQTIAQRSQRQAA